jgi:hypothetical protein
LYSRIMEPLNYSKSFLKRLNGITVNGVPVYDFFIYDGHSLWSFFQQLIWEDIKKFSNNPLSSVTKPRLNYVYSSLPAFFVSAVSCLALMKFLLKRPRFFIFGTDIAAGDIKADLRIGKVYKYLMDRKIGYGEILHTNISRRAVSNFFKRKRTVFYLESLRLLHRVYKLFKRKNFFEEISPAGVDLENFSDSEKKIIFFLLKKYSRLAEFSIFKIKILEKIFRLIKPRLVFLIDDSRYYHEILLAAKSAGIKTCMFQHSRFNEYLPGWIYYGIPPEKCIVPDRYYLWNEYWVGRLLKLSPVFNYYQDRVKIGGRPYLGQNIEFVETLADDIITVLMPYEKFAVVSKVKKCVAKILECGKTKVVFKLRKDEPEKEQLERFGLDSGHPNFEAVADLNKDLLEKIDLVIGTHSTMLYDLAEAGKAVSVLKTENTQAQDLIEDGLAAEIDCEEDICLQINKASDIDRSILLERSNRLKTTIDFESTFLGEIKSISQ